MKELSNTDALNEEIKSPNVIILFYMDGCPHCENVKKYWDKLEDNKPSGTKYAQIESAKLPSDMISGFPTFKKFSNGKEIKTINGEVTNEEFNKQLGLSGGRRRRFRSRRGKRKSRSTRRHIPLRSKLTSTR